MKGVKTICLTMLEVKSKVLQLEISQKTTSKMLPIIFQLRMNSR